MRGNEIATPISHLDILNYQIAHLIRHETAEGHTLVEFLIHIMSGKDRPFTPRKFRIKPADRMAAARELLRRGFGDLGSRRKPSDITDEANAYDTLHTDLAKRMREYSERGTDTVRFLLEVMSDPDPEQEFTIHHRMSAAQELLRRGWDTNYDNIKPQHLQDYWRDKESSRLSIGQKKTQAGLSTSIDDYDNYDDTDYEAIAKEMREEEEPAKQPPVQNLVIPAKAGIQRARAKPQQSPLSLRERVGVRAQRTPQKPNPTSHSMTVAKPSSRSSRKRWQAATTGPPSAPRQSSSAGKSPETSNHTSPPTRTYSPTTDHSTKRNRQSSTKNRRHRLPQQATPTLRCR